MKALLILLLPAALTGCVVGTVAKTAVDVVTLPVKVASAATTSQKEADEKRGRELRRQDEERGKQLRMAQERCRKGKPLPTDNCAALLR